LPVFVLREKERFSPLSKGRGEEERGSYWPMGQTNMTPDGEYYQGEAKEVMLFRGAQQSVPFSTKRGSRTAQGGFLTAMPATVLCGEGTRRNTRGETKGSAPTSAKVQQLHWQAFVSKKKRGPSELQREGGGGG